MQRGRWSGATPERKRRRKAWARDHFRKLDPRVKILRDARFRARRVGLPFDLAVDDIVVPEFCPLLGLRLRRGSGTGKHRAASPSLDRIDPARGYVRGNVWVISYRANAIKQDASIDELRRLAHNLERLEWAA